MANSGLRHIALRTPDLKETERFYVDVLGMKVAFRIPPRMLFLRTSGSSDLVNFVRSTRRISPNQGLDHIGFKVTRAGLKKTERTLQEKGIPIEGRRGRSAIYFLDPNGYRIEYYCD